MSGTGISKGLPNPYPGQTHGSAGSARTDAGGDGGAALLVALGAAVAGDACHTILAWALTRGLVAGFAGGAHRVAITGCEGNTTGGSEKPEGACGPLSRGNEQG